MLATLRDLSPWVAFSLMLAQNVVVFALALLGGHCLVRVYAHRPVNVAPDAVTRTELVVAITAVVLNTGVTFVGWLLWRSGVIEFRTDVGLRALLDVVLLLLIMDAAMYGLHRVAHHRWFFGVLHALHHRYDRPRPLTLFVLHPFEAISFGALWLIVIAMVSWSWLGMSLYLALNVAFGIIGHLGVEPLPARGYRVLGSSTFHSDHHERPAHNFGFYTTLWDRCFGTLGNF